MAAAHLITSLVVNTLTIVLGFTLLVTASVFVSNINHISDICPQIYSLSILSVVIGVLAIVLTSTLTIWIVKQYPIFSKVFAGLLIFVIFLAPICAIILLITRSNLQTTTFNRTTTIFNNYSDSNNTLGSKDIVSQIQQSFECCGIQSPRDWKNLTYDGASTPDSCCHVMITNCGKHALIKEDNIYLDGCAQSIYHYFKKIFTTLIGMNFSIAIVTSASCLIALYLKQFMQQPYESV